MIPSTNGAAPLHGELQERNGDHPRGRCRGRNALRGSRLRAGATQEGRLDRRAGAWVAAGDSGARTSDSSQPDGAAAPSLDRWWDVEPRRRAATRTRKAVAGSLAHRGATRGRAALLDRTVATLGHIWY